MTDRSERDVTQWAKSPSHSELGAALRSRRLAAGVSTRQISDFSAGHVSNVENGRVTPSESFVNAYAARFGGGAELGALYSKLRLSGERQRGLERVRRNPKASAVIPPTSVTAATTPEAVSRHYTTVHQTADCQLGSKGQIKSIQIRGTVEALSPDVQLFYAAAFYEVDPSPGVTTIVPTAGLQMVDIQEADSGAIRAYLRLDRPLGEPGDRHAIGYDIRVDSQVRTLPKLLFYARPGMASMSLTARFELPSVPTKLWQVAGRNVIMANHWPSDRVEPEASGDYRITFQDLVPGWVYGFSWNW